MTNDIRKKWWYHRNNAKRKGVNSHLTFEDYCKKLEEANITADDIGTGIDKYHLGRIGDEGDYTIDSCRFITHRQNRQEKIDNGHNDYAAINLSKFLKGKTKETSEWIAKSAITRSKFFVATSPSGEIIKGRNLKQFCKENDLTHGLMSMVATGKVPHHKGWKVRYVDHH